jgi:hypothetical protein
LACWFSESSVCVPTLETVVALIRKTPFPALGIIWNLSGALCGVRAHRLRALLALSTSNFEFPIFTVGLI